MSAKEICAKLITRKLSQLSTDEMDEVYDFLDDKGYDINIDMSSRQLCTILMEDLMKDDSISKGLSGKSRIPMTAFANKVLKDENEKRLIKEEKMRLARIKRQRSEKKKELESQSRQLQGCRKNRGFLPNVMYNQVMDLDIGIFKSGDQEYYGAFIQVPMQLYMKIFNEIDSPIIELKTNTGLMTYARIEGPHNGNNRLIKTSPLISNLLDDKSTVTLNLCIDMPIIENINFLYYGSEEELNSVRRELSVKLPDILNRLASLNLGMELQVMLDSGLKTVLVDGLYDLENTLVFSGIFPLGESNIDFNISPDM